MKMIQGLTDATRPRLVCRHIGGHLFLILWFVVALLCPAASATPMDTPDQSTRPPTPKKSVDAPAGLQQRNSDETPSQEPEEDDEDGEDLETDGDLEDQAEAYVPPPPPDGILPLEELDPIEFAPSDRVIPTLIGERLILVARDGSVSSYDPADASFLWKLGLSSQALLRPTSLGHEETVWIASRSGDLFEINVSEGSLVRELRSGVELTIAPAGVTSRLYLATKNNRVLALDPSDGTKLWEFDVGEPIAALSASGPYVAVSGRERTLSLLDAESGTRLWAYATLRGFSAPAVFDDEGRSLYIGDEVGDFLCLNLEDGGRRFRWSTGASIRTPVLVEGKRVYVPTYGNIVFAFDSGTGNEQWRAHIAGRPAMAPQRVFQRLIIATLDGGLEELQPATGRVTASYRLPGELLLAPAMYFEPVPVDASLVIEASLESDLGVRDFGPSLESDSLFEVPALSGLETEGGGINDGIDEDSELGRALAAASEGTNVEGESVEPLWFEKGRIAATLRSGQVVLLKHQRPAPPVPTELGPDGVDPEVPGDEPGVPAKKPPKPPPPRVR